MIKVRYLVQVGYTADVDDTDPNILPIEEIKKGFADASKVFEKFLKDEIFDCECGKLTVTEIINDITKE